jgi:hypothetical protein
MPARTAATVAGRKSITLLMFREFELGRFVPLSTPFIDVVDDPLPSFLASELLFLGMS